MLTLNYTEFYITNVCNISCDNCNRFNNFSFNGHQLWIEYAKEYRKWADIIEIKEIGILGGEPLTNPDFLNWVENIAILWPTSKIRIITNGTLLKRWPNLYDVLLKYKGRIVLDISVHNYLWKKEIIKDVVDFCRGECKLKTEYDKHSWQISYNNVKDLSWPDCNDPLEFRNLPEYIQKECLTVHNVDPEDDQINGVIFFKEKQEIAILSMSTNFNNSTIQHNKETHKLTVCNSDPSKAISVCYSKKCHHFIKGKLYKCGPVGLLPEFIKQFNVELNNTQKELINSYRPLSVTDSKIEQKIFLDNLINELPIPQCTFCPESLTPVKFSATKKKYKIEKLSPTQVK